MRYKKETKKNRKATLRRYRRRVKLAVRNDQEPERFRKTEGWLSW